MTRLRFLPLATVLLVLLALKLDAEDTASPQPSPNDTARVPNEPGDKKKPETPAERTARVVRLLRYEVLGDVRCILDTTFPYSKEVAQLEADFDKCLDEERYEDGTKVVSELIKRLREEQGNSQKQYYKPKSIISFTEHVLLAAWEFEAALCQRAADREFGAGEKRRSLLATARLQAASDFAKALKPIETPYGNWVGANLDRLPLAPIASTNDPSTAAYLLLRSVKAAERQTVVSDEAIAKALSAVSESIEVDLPIPAGVWPVSDGLQAVNFRETRIRLNAIPDDAMLAFDISSSMKLQVNTFLLEPSVSGEPLRKLQIGSQHEAKLALQKWNDAELQKRIHSTLQKLFPSETIDVRVVRGTVVLRAPLKQAVHEQQIVDIARALSPNLLNQMTVRNVGPPEAPAEAEKLTPFGEDSHGLREALAQLFPHEQIEVHVLPSVSAVVLRGHLSRPESAKQVFDVASTLYATILYQMTPPLPGTQTANVVDEDQSVPKPGQILAEDAPVAAPVVAANPPAHPQEAAMDRQAHQLAKKYRSAKLDEQPALRKQLEELTERHFEQRQQRRQREIEDLSQRLDKLRATHQRRQENKAAVVRQRIQDLLDPNADLRWDEPGTNSSSIDSIETATAPAGGQTSPATANVKTTGPSNALTEPTYDGTPYSQWLQMLETERKPEKLAAAIDVCSRLTSKEDAPRVFRGIIAGWEQFRDSRDYQKRNKLFEETRSAVQRMLVERGSEVSESAAEGLLALVKDSEKVEADSFLVQRVLWEIHSANKPIVSLQSRAPQYIAALVKHCATSQNVEGKLGAVATGFWVLSGKPANDFDGLRPLILREFDYELAQNIGMDYGSGWWRNATRPEGYAQIPEIVPLLVKHFGTFSRREKLVWELGNLGPAAEPAVPQLVEYFVLVWNAQEEQLREGAAGKTQTGWDENLCDKMNGILEALGKIGPGARQAIPLLRELTSIAPTRGKEFDPAKNRCDRIWGQVDKTRLIIDKNLDQALPESKHLLSDFSHLRTIWKLKTIRPTAPVMQVILLVGDSFWLRTRRVADDNQVLALMNVLGLSSSGPQYKIDETTLPKQITLLPDDFNRLNGDGDYEQFGIYELSGDQLKIEFAKRGKPRPTAFSSDPDKLPADRILLLFERDRGAPDGKVTDAASPENGSAKREVPSTPMAPNETKPASPAPES